MALVILPASLTTLFPGAPRKVEGIEARTVAEAIDALDQLWPGMRDRLCDGRPSLRRHITVFVDGERADLATELGDSSELHVVPAVSGG